MLDSAGSGCGPVAVFFSEQRFGPVKGGESLGQQSDYQIFK
jgi:hypothetical protein